MLRVLRNKFIKLETNSHNEIYTQTSNEVYSGKDGVIWLANFKKKHEKN
jgi:hypothetical protein